MTAENPDFPANFDALPCLVIDTREQAPLPIRRLRWVRAGLVTGDYSLAGAEHIFAVERKSIADLVACCGTERARFERELHRLRGCRFRRLLIVGSEAETLTGRYCSGMNPRSVLASVRAFEVRYDVPVVWEPDPEHAACLVERWAAWFSYDLGRCADAIAKRYPRQEAAAAGPADMNSQPDQPKILRR